MTAQPLDDDLRAFAADLAALSPAALAAYLEAHPDDLDVIEAALAGAELARFSAEVDPTADWRANPATFAHHLSRGRMRLYRYAVFLARKFVDAVEGRSPRQIWNLAPQYGKSAWASQWGPAWVLDRFPEQRIILVSYGDDLATANAYAVRDILREHADVLNTQLRRDQQRLDRFLTSAGGGVLATGIDGAATGFPAHGLVIDDPFKNWQEAHSAARRAHVFNQYRSVFRMRQTAESMWIVLVMTRWHEQDLAAQLYRDGLEGRGEAWELVRLPEVAEAPVPDAVDPVLRLVDPLGRAPGELLEPQRFGSAAVAARFLAAGSYLAAAMHQQRPAPEEGGEIQRAWWRIEDVLPSRFDASCSSWDVKLKDKESGDYVVGQAWGRTASDFWCLDQLRGQWDQATTTNAIALLSVRHPAITLHVIENTGNGPEVMAALRAPHPDYSVPDAIAGLLGMTEDERAAVSALRQRGLPGLVPNTPKGPKTVRARAVVPYIEAGNVHLPARAPWLGVFLDEHSAFSNGAYDDQVDAMSQALSRLAVGPAVASAPRQSIPKTPINMPRSGIASIGRITRTR